MEKHLTGLGYVMTYVGLLALATLSFGFSFAHLARGELPVSLIIAGAKAALVFWFFMHLHEQRFANRLVVLVSFALVAILIGLIATDVESRHTFPAAPRPTESQAQQYQR